MPRLPVVSGRKAAKVFSKAGWRAHRQVGSHLVMRKEGSKVTLSVPQHKEIRPGLLKRLIRDAGLTVEEFCKLL